MAYADEGHFPAIEGAAYERYLLDLVRGYAAEQERMDSDLTPLIREIQLAGDEYPHPGFMIRTYNPRNGKEQTKMHLLYENPDFYSEDGERRVETTRIAGDILMLARGG
jgi:hypothetical protein